MSSLVRRRSNWGLRGLAGFSLVELILAIALIGIATALTLPKIGTVTNQTKVQRAAQALTQDVQQAYAIAGRNRAPVTLRWSSTTMQLQVANLAGTTIYKRTGYGSGGGYGLVSSEVTIYPTVLTVFPNGLANDTMLISVARKGFSRKIWVSKSGMILKR